MDWTAIGLADYVPSIKDLYLPALTAGLYWAFKKLCIPAINKLIFLLKGLRFRELKKAKNIRIDRLKVFRELSKESALYASFLLSAVISLGLMILPVQPSARPNTDKILQFFFYLAPVLILEIMWLWQKSFVDTLVEEAAKLPNEITRYIKVGKNSPVREALRRKRADKIKSKKSQAFKEVRRKTY